MSVFTLSNNGFIDSFLFKFIDYTNEIVTTIQIKFSEIINYKKSSSDLSSKSFSPLVTSVLENENLNFSDTADKAASTFDYFVHGHGVQALETFPVPDNMIIKFYVKEGKLFDDAWMKTVREQNKPPADARFKDFAREDYQQKEQCPNYALAYPTGLCVDFSVDAQTDIQEGMVVEPTKNNLMLPLGKVGIIKKPTKEIRKLDWIVQELRKNHQGKLILHWCACREETDISLPEWIDTQIEKGSLRKRVQ